MSDLWGRCQMHRLTLEAYAALRQCQTCNPTDAESPQMVTPSSKQTTQSASVFLPLATAERLLQEMIPRAEHRVPTFRENSIFADGDGVVVN